MDLKFSHSNINIKLIMSTYTTSNVIPKEKMFDGDFLESKKLIEKKLPVKWNNIQYLQI